MPKEFSFKFTDMLELTPDERARQYNTASAINALQEDALTQKALRPVQAASDSLGKGTWYGMVKTAIEEQCNTIRELKREPLATIDVNMLETAGNRLSDVLEQYVHGFVKKRLHPEMAIDHKADFEKVAMALTTIREQLDVRERRNIPDSELFAGMRIIFEVFVKDELNKALGVDGAVSKIDQRRTGSDTGTTERG